MKLHIGPDAFAKLKRCRDTHDTEVGGWFISKSLDDLLEVVDFRTVKQTVTKTTVEFDDDSMTEYITEMCEQEVWPVMCQKIWVHTHPGNSSTPSGTDWDTLNSLLEKIDVNDWIIMFILAMDNSYTCKFAYKTPLGNVFQDIKCEFMDYYYDEWDEEFKKNIFKKQLAKPKNTFTSGILPAHKNIFSTKPLFSAESVEEVTDLCVYDIPEILFTNKVDSFNDLDPLLLTEIAKSYGCSTDYLFDLEKSMRKSEESCAAEYVDILKDYAVTSLDKLTDQQWEEVVCAYMVSKKGLLEEESRQFRTESNSGVNTNMFFV